MNNNDSDEWSVQQVAGYLRMSLATARKWVRDGKIVPSRINPYTRAHVFSKKQIMEIFKEK